ncbi:MAG: FG-GAP repeat protein [Thermodesulfobacteriota bacterium]|nr:FG-GAP repeat protein [Thermodesulfobacteriota bacterium]
MKHHNVSGVLSILALIFFVSVAHSTTFDFNTDNQGWKRVGLYDNGSLVPVPGYFSDDPAQWSDVPGSGAIALGSGGFTMPASPSGSTYLHWDLNSPDLNGNVQWQGITSFTYDVTGEYMWSSANIYIQAVLHVKKSDGTESYFSDFQFHEIPLESAGAWDSHTLDVTSLGLPAGATILGVNLRIFFEASSGHDGFIFVDNVTPIEGSSNLLVNPKADEGTNAWTFYKHGSADSGVLTMANNNNVFYVQRNGNDGAHIFQDINLPESSGGKYLLLLGYGWVEHIYNGYITNHPYLYGYEINQSNKIVDYLQGQNMRHTATEKTWQTMSGIYQINVDTAKIRLFLNQASHAYQEPDGTKAAFNDLELLVFDTEAEAIAYENTYTSNHPEVYEGEPATAAGLEPWQGISQAGLGANEADDYFGHVQASGDFNGDGYMDLAVGAPGEAPGSDPRSGYVFVFKGLSD